MPNTRNSDEHVDPLIKLIEQFESGDYDQFFELASSSAGLGSSTGQISQFMSNFDRFRSGWMSTPKNLTGYTFITRPTLCLLSHNLQRDARFAILNTVEHRSPMYGIRCWLDPRYARYHFHHSSNCPFVDPWNPFFVPLMNGLRSISGFPQLSIKTETTQEGYFGESQTYAGVFNEWFGETQMSLTFRDIELSPIFNIFLFWILTMAHLYRGKFVAYVEDIDDRIMPYTVSIYRFVMDPTNTYITHSARAVGCFPAPGGLPTDALFNIDDNQMFVNNINSFSISFAANGIVIEDPRTFMYFNKLVDDFTGGVDFNKPMEPTLLNNYTGIPYITFERKGPKLGFYERA